MLKRTFDCAAALLGIILLFPLLLLVAVAIKFDSPGPVFFMQERIGRRFRPFRILKFRTMLHGAEQMGSQITLRQDPRVTRVGSILRATKVDELPQLINILKGDMSVVGPRPEVGRYVEALREEYAEVLEVRPGLTDLASLKYVDEEAMLKPTENWNEHYTNVILPDKIRLAKEYVAQASFALDLTLIVRTLVGIVRNVGGGAIRRIAS